MHLEHNLTFKDLLMQLAKSFVSAVFLVFLKEALMKEFQVQHANPAEAKTEIKPAEVRNNLIQKGLKSSFYTYLDILVCEWAILRPQGKSNKINPFLIANSYCKSAS